MNKNAWQPVKTNCTGNSFSCEVLKRSYEFDKSIFPTEVKINGENILFAPISLNADFSGKAGAWEKQCVIKIAEDEEKAVYSVSQSCENIIVNADITVEYDGFVRVDFRVMNFWAFDKDNKARLTGLSLDIPIKNEFATLMHFWPN